MAQVNIEELLDHLSDELRGALRDALQEVLPNITVSEFELFRAFQRAIDRRCATWEPVPDYLVRR
jgi:hypothetical protein